MTRRRRAGQGAKLATLIAKFDSRCHICEEIILEKHTRDHGIPASIGGANNISNYLLAHSSCNQARADLPLEELSLIKEQVRKNLAPKEKFRFALIHILKKVQKNNDQREIYEGFDSAPT